MLTGDDERTFVNNLADIALVFHGKVTPNEATARNYINPFMHKAVAMLMPDYPSMRLAVEENFVGTRGYGPLDYAVVLEELAIMVTEAKKEDLQKGVAQNLVQLHTAAEVIKFILTSFYRRGYPIYIFKLFFRNLASASASASATI